MLDAILGNASKANNAQVQKQHAAIFIPDETVEAAFRLVRDLIVFTNKRLIMIDVQGITGSKVEYLSVPYKSIRYFSVETAGRFDRDAELKIWVASGGGPTVSKQLKKGIDIVSLQRTLAYFVLG